MTERNGGAYADEVDLDDSTSIDDLLGFAEEPPPTKRRRATGVGWWVRTLLVAAGAAAVTVFGLRLFGFEISIVLCVAGYLALLVLRRVTGTLAPPPVRRGVRSRGGEEDGMYDFTERDALRPAVARWERLLTRAAADTGSARAMHRTLVELADERLRQRHSVTRDGDPTRAKALLGDGLWDYLTTPPTRNLAPRDAAAYVQSLERL
jgi:hypothetical protein